MHAATTQPVGRVLSACATGRGQSGVDAADRRPVPGNAVLWLAADDMASGVFEEPPGFETNSIIPFLRF